MRAPRVRAVLTHAYVRVSVRAAPDSERTPADSDPDTSAARKHTLGARPPAWHEDCLFKTSTCCYCLIVLQQKNKVLVGPLSEWGSPRPLWRRHGTPYLPQHQRPGLRV